MFRSNDNNVRADFVLSKSYLIKLQFFLFEIGHGFNKIKSKKKDDSVSSVEDSGSYEINACCLCHCCFDFTDRAGFFQKDREKDYSVCNPSEIKTIEYRSETNDNEQLNKDDILQSEDAFENTDQPQNDDVNKSEDKIETNDADKTKNDDIIKSEDKIGTNDSDKTKKDEIIKLDLCVDIEEKHDNSVSYNIITTTDATQAQPDGSHNSENFKRNIESCEGVESPKPISASCQLSKPEKNGDEIQSSDIISAVSSPQLLDVVSKEPALKASSEGDSEKQSIDDDEESSYFFRRNDPYLPESLYDPDNALVYCDTCDRLFHQKCHFVPLLQVPKGEWSCLICTSKISSTKTSINRKQKSRRKSSVFSENIFISPPDASVREDELKWEADPNVINAKSNLLCQWTSVRNETGKETSKLKRMLNQQLSSVRLAETALSTLTSTQQNRKHCYSAKTGKPSQELASSMLKFYSAKHKLRCQIQNINSIREVTPQYKRWNDLMAWVQLHQNDHTEFIKRVIFPFGLAYERRWEPRTPEYEQDMHENLLLENKQSGIPEEIHVVQSQSSTCIPCPQISVESTKTKAASHASQLPIEKYQEKSKKQEKIEPETPDSFSLDQLTCSLCLLGTTSDENDLVLCDGEGCYRAFHMKCVIPHITSDELEEQESWFCPWCSVVADWMYEVQCHWLGEDWEKKKLGYLMEKGDDNSASDSVESWEDVKDVFPESKWEYESALKIKRGDINDDTKRLITQVLGLEDYDKANSEEDDLDVDGNFDMYSYEVDRNIERKQMKKSSSIADEASNDDSSSTHSSQATLVEMSSMELEVGSDELAALSDVDLSEANSQTSKNDGSDADNVESGGNRRRSRRNRKSREVEPTDDDSSENRETPANDPGKMDENNILYGKRNRTPVDYRKLNDAIFGDWDEVAAANLDGGADYGIRARRKANKPGIKSRKRNSNLTDGKSMRPRTAKKLQHDASTKHISKANIHLDGICEEIPKSSKTTKGTEDSTKTKQKRIEKKSIEGTRKGTKDSTENEQKRIKEKTAEGTRKESKEDPAENEEKRIKEKSAKGTSKLARHKIKSKANGKLQSHPHTAGETSNGLTTSERRLARKRKVKK